jgi:6-phosphogluconolactonase
VTVQHDQGYQLDFGARGTVTVVADGSALARAAAERVARAIDAAVAARGRAFVALSGGSTPKQMGSILSRDPYRSGIPWEKVDIFWGDERWVPLASPESNAGEAKRGFLDLVAIPSANVHPWNTSARSAEEAAAAYEAEIREVLGAPMGMPQFDLILLGMGEDGHTASLFPNTTALAIKERVAVANFVPKLDAERLTLTEPAINAAREILFLAGGPGKAATLEKVLEGPQEPAELPAQAIHATPGETTVAWLVDEDAAAQLDGASR